MKRALLKLALASIGAMAVAGQAKAAVHWGPVRTSCSGTSLRTSAQLMDIPWGQSWETTCSNMRTGPRGFNRKPDKCVNNAGMWGEWYTKNHPNCTPKLEWANAGRECLEAINGWRSKVYARLWNIPAGSSWRTTCEATDASGEIATKFGARGKPARCEESFLGVTGVWGVWEIADDDQCASPNFARYPFWVHNRSSQRVFVTPMWLGQSGKTLYTQDSRWVDAGGNVVFNVAGPLKCDEARFEAELQGIQTSLRGMNGDRDSCLGQHFQVFFWDSDAGFYRRAAEGLTIATISWLATDWILGQGPTGGFIPIPGADEASQFAVDKWEEFTNPDGKLTNYGVHGWAYNVPQQSAHVVYWGPEVSQDVILGDSVNARTLAHPWNRGFMFEVAESDRQIQRPCKRTDANSMLVERC